MLCPSKFYNGQLDFGITHSHFNSSVELRNGLCVSVGVKSTIDHAIDVKHALERYDLAKSLEKFADGGDHVSESVKSQTITEEESSSCLPPGTYKYDGASHTNANPNLSNAQKFDRLYNLKKAVNRQLIKDDTDIRFRPGCLPSGGTETPAIHDASQLSRESGSQSPGLPVDNIPQVRANSSTRRLVKVHDSRKSSLIVGTAFHGMKAEEGTFVKLEPCSQQGRQRRIKANPKRRTMFKGSMTTKPTIKTNVVDEPVVHVNALGHLIKQSSPIPKAKPCLPKRPRSKSLPSKNSWVPQQDPKSPPRKKRTKSWAEASRSDRDHVYASAQAVASLLSSSELTGQYPARRAIWDAEPTTNGGRRPIRRKRGRAVKVPKRDLEDHDTQKGDLLGDVLADQSSSDGADEMPCSRLPKARICEPW